MQEGGLKKKLGWLEAGLYLGGVALLAVFFQIRVVIEGLRVDREAEKQGTDGKNAE